MSYLLLHLDGFLELGINKNDKFNIMKIRTHSSDLNSTLPSYCDLPLLFYHTKLNLKRFRDLLSLGKSNLEQGVSTKIPTMAVTRWSTNVGV